MRAPKSPRTPDMRKSALTKLGLSKPLLPAHEREPPTSHVRRLTAEERINALLKSSAAAADSRGAPPEVGSGILQMGPCLAATLRAVMFVAPLYAWLYGGAYKLYKTLPTTILQLIFGGALCLFGGVFAASISAIEAFRLMGWQRVKDDVAIVMKEAGSVGAASAEDDLVDADGDGIADVDQQEVAELVQRKLLLAMKTVSEPARLQSALGGLWAAYLAVLATLRLEFAQTTALALGAVEILRYPCMRLLAPPMATALAPLGVGHWVETVVDVSIRLVAVVLAWYLRMVVSAFYSALRGGRMVADGLCAIVLERGWQGHVERLPGVAAPFHPDTSHLDEAVAYSLAALGFAFQLLSGFGLPFPLNVIFLPLELLEWLLRWQITFAAPDKPLAAG